MFVLSIKGTIEVLEVLWCQSFEKVLHFQSLSIFSQVLGTMYLLEQVKVLLMGLKHIQHAVFGVLMVVACFNAQLKVFLYLVENIHFHWKPTVSAIEHLYQIFAEFDALIVCITR